MIPVPVLISLHCLLAPSRIAQWLHLCLPNLRLFDLQGLPLEPHSLQHINISRYLFDQIGVTVDILLAYRILFNIPHSVKGKNIIISMQIQSAVLTMF